MIDPELERQLSDCRTLLQLWSRFQEYFQAAVKGQGIAPENEHKFLELKSRMAMLHDTFMAAAEEKQASVAQNMLENVNRAITLKHINRMSNADVRKIEIEWHETYLLLNETIGALEEESLRKSKISKSHWGAMQARKKVGRVIGNVYHSWGLRVGLIAGVILFLLIGLPMMGVFSYGALRDVAAIEKPVYWVLENVVRQHVNKNLAWRTMNEAFDFGRRPPAEVFNDFVSEDPTRDLPRDPQSAAQWLAQKAGQAPQEFSQKVKLADAKDFRLENWLVKDQKFICMYFLMDTVPTANELVNQYKRWVDGLPPQTKGSISEQTEIVNDYNLVILMITPNGGMRAGFRDQVWEIPKVKR